MIMAPTPQRPGYPSQADWPTREQALAIIDALGRMVDGGMRNELDRLSGVANAATVAEQCYAVYGYPELEGGAVSRRIAEAFMQRRRDCTTKAPEAVPDTAAPVHSYGMTPRA
jgi:hypothetical protein